MAGSGSVQEVNQWRVPPWSLLIWLRVNLCERGVEQNDYRIFSRFALDFFHGVLHRQFDLDRCLHQKINNKVFVVTVM